MFSTTCTATLTLLFSSLLLAPSSTAAQENVVGFKLVEQDARCNGDSPNKVVATGVTIAECAVLVAADDFCDDRFFGREARCVCIARGATCNTEGHPKNSVYDVAVAGCETPTKSMPYNTGCNVCNAPHSVISLVEFTVQTLAGLNSNARTKITVRAGFNDGDAEILAEALAAAPGDVLQLTNMRGAMTIFAEVEGTGVVGSEVFGGSCLRQELKYGKRVAGGLLAISGFQSVDFDPVTQARIRVWDQTSCNRCPTKSLVVTTTTTTTAEPTTITVTTSTTDTTSTTATTAPSTTQQASGCPSENLKAPRKNFHTEGFDATIAAANKFKVALGGKNIAMSKCVTKCMNLKEGCYGIEAIYTNRRHLQMKRCNLLLKSTTGTMVLSAKATKVVVYPRLSVCHLNTDAPVPSTTPSTSTSQTSATRTSTSKTTSTVSSLKPPQH
jgi:hypothetical protein